MTWWWVCAALRPEFTVLFSDDQTAIARNRLARATNLTMTNHTPF
jgi:hypothetical protein